jgi:PDZ domain-containing protein
MSDPRSIAPPLQPPDPGWQYAPGVPSVAPKRRRWPTVLLVVALVVAGLALIASHIELNEWAVTPGQAQNVAPLIRVPPDRAHPVTGTIMLTDVYLSQISLLQWIPTHLDSNAQIVPNDQVVDPGTPASQLAAQGFVQMQQAQDDARAAALTRLGYTVAQHDGGAQIVAIGSGTPAEQSLSVGDVVTAVNGTPTPDSCSFTKALHPLAPGDVARLTVEPVTFNANGTPIYGKTKVTAVRTTAAPRGTAASGCPGVSTPNRAHLGVAVETDVVFGFPFHVGLDPSGIGGPSAGLAMTLGIIDKLSGGRLAHGVIAATGTIDPQQQVGAVGGVPQKTVAVENAGATLFLVPPANFKDALSKDNASLRVCEVSSLGQALGDLAHFGGHVAASLHPQPFDPRRCN